MRRFTDEELVAYVDGESGTSIASEIREAAARDPALQRRIQVFSVSRRILENAFQSKRNEPVPERLLRVFDLRAGAAGGSTAAPAGIARRRIPRYPLAMAATVLLALGIAFSEWSHRPSTGMVAYVAAPEILSAALEKSAVGVPFSSDATGAHHEVVALATLKLRDGTWCREFDSAQIVGNDVQRSRGVACRSPSGEWVARAVAPASQPPRDTSAYQLASGPSLLPALGPAEVLTPMQEQAAIASGWKQD